MKRNKRFLSAVLALVLCLSMLPVSALALELPELDVLESTVEAVEAEEEPVGEDVEEPVEETEPEQEPEVEVEDPIETTEEEIEAEEEPIDVESSENEESDTTTEIAGDESSELEAVASDESTALLGTNESWLWPVASSKIISSNFGMRDLNGLSSDGKESFHSGIDIAASIGTEVRATKSGTIIDYCNKYGESEKTGSQGMASYGNYVAIKHDDGTYSIYAHLSPTGMKTSGYVTQGTVIALSGDSGNSGGPHLHFQATKNPSPSWSNAANLINTMPTESTISKYGITVRNGYEAASGYSTQRMEYIFSLSYLDQCKSIPTYLTVKVTKATTLKKYPCAAATDASSTNIAFPSIGDTFDVYAMWENTEGNYWYEVKYNGTTCYLYSGDTEVTKHRMDDVTISGVSAPSSVTTGNDFSLKGLITSNYNTIGTIQGYIVPGKVSSYTEGTPVQKVNRESLYVKSYEINKSAIDTGLTFETLSPGTYTYCVNVVVPNYYSSDGETISTWWPAKEVVVQSFTVQNAGATSFKVTFNANGGSLPTATNTYTADGVNVSRGDGTVIVYDQAGSTVATNAYGVEAVVSAEGKITSKRAYLSTTQVTVPSGGMVISGHAMWVNDSPAACLQFMDSLKVGQYVAYDYATRIISVYDTHEAYLAGAKYVELGGTYGTLPTPTRSGYTFAGWYTEASGGTKITSSSTYTTSILYAHWTHQDHSYSGTVTKTVTCEEDGETTFTCTCGDSYVEVVAATGHIWDAGKVTTEAGPGTTGVKTYTCGVCGETKTEIIAALPKEYTIAYDANGGSGAPAFQTKTHNVTMTLSSTVPTRDGYTFLGWASSKTATSAEYTAGSSYTGNANVTLYAVWEAIPVVDAPKILVSNTSAAPGSTAEVTVSLESNPGIASFELEVIYDKTKLKWTGVTKGDLGGNWDVAVGENVLWVNAEDYTEDGVILTLIFEVLDGTTGEASVSVAYNSGDIFNADEENVSFEVVAGTIVIKSHVPGDVNNDGVTNNKDLLRLMKYLKGKDVEVNKAALDINGDGSENNKDLLRLMKYLKGKDVEIY